MLPKPINQQINRLAHKLALRYEYDTRDSILAEIIEKYDSGADLKQLTQALIRIEAAKNKTGK